MSGTNTPEAGSASGTSEGEARRVSQRGGAAGPDAGSTPNLTRRLGILGGSFNPIHHAHLFSAEVAAAALGLETVLVVPAAQSPFKQLGTVSTEHRVEMVRLAIVGNDRLRLDTVDVDRPPPSYTVDTVAQLQARWPEHELVLILGMDALVDLLEWREPERLLDLCRLAVVSRLGYQLKVPPRIRQALGERAERIELVPMPELEISSTAIRRRLAAGEPVRYLLPQVVETYIREHRLYDAMARPTGDGRAAVCSVPGKDDAILTIDEPGRQTSDMVQSLPVPDDETPTNDDSMGTVTAGGAAPATLQILRPAPPTPEPREGEPDALGLAKDIVQFASDKGGADILLMDIRKLSIIADYFVICTGDNDRQIRAISRGIMDGVDEEWGVDPLNKAGTEQEQVGWVVLDYGGVVVHIFSPQMREFYRLERLWSEAATLLRMQ